MNTTMFDLPLISQNDWEQFKQNASPFVFARVIDRNQMAMPPEYAPLARGVAVPCDYFLNQLGFFKQSFPSNGWTKHQMSGGWEKVLRKTEYLVRECSNLYSVERWPGSAVLPGPADILVSRFGATPIFAADAQRAMFLAELGDDQLPSKLQWIQMFPQWRRHEAEKFAEQRRIAEASTAKAPSP